MARIRSVKPDFWKSESIADLSSDSVRLCFIGLWNYADDEGRGRDDARLVKAELFPLDDSKTTSVVENLLTELADQGHIIRYIADGKKLFEIPGFKDHQKPNRPMTSKYPPLSEQEVSDHEQRTASSVSDHEQRTAVVGEGVGIVEGEGEVVTAAPTPNESAVRLANLLADLIEGNGSKRPAVSAKWITTMDRLLRIDERDEAEAEAVMRWSQEEPFWQSVIMSADKFRDKYDKLRLQWQRPQTRSGTSRDGRAPQSWDVLSDMHKKAKAQEAMNANQ